MNRIVTSLLVAFSVALVQCSIRDIVNLSMEQMARESKCLEKYNLTIEEVATQPKEMKPQIKCYLACFFEYAEILQNCTFIAEDFSTDEVLVTFHNLIVSCKGAVTSGDSCECGFQFANCLTDQEFPLEADN